MSLATASFHSDSEKLKKPKAEFKWDDPLLLSEQLTEDERLVMEAARSYCQEKLYPRGNWRRGRCRQWRPRQILERNGIIGRQV